MGPNSENGKRQTGRVVLDQSSSDYITLLSEDTDTEDPLVRRVDILPLRSISVEGKITFNVKKIYETLGLDGLKLVAYCEKSGMGEVLNSEEFGVVLPDGEGGSFVLAPLLNPSRRVEVVDDRDNPNWSIASLHPSARLVPSKKLSEPLMKIITSDTAPTHSNDPELFSIPSPPEVSSNSPSTIGHKRSNSNSDNSTMLSSMAYVAILITVLLSYIAPRTSKTIRGFLPESQESDDDTGKKESASSGSGSEEGRDTKEINGNGNDAKEDNHDDDGLSEKEEEPEEKETVIFDLKQVNEGDICAFLIHCTPPKLKELEFQLNGTDLEVPLKEIKPGKDLWLLEVGKSKVASMLSVRLREHDQN